MITSKRYAFFILLLASAASCGKPTSRSYRHIDDVPRSDAHPEPKDGDLQLDRSFHSKAWPHETVEFALHEDWTGEEVKQIALAMQIWNEAIGRDLLRMAPQRSQRSHQDHKFYDTLEDTLNEIYPQANWELTAKPLITIGSTLWDNDDEHRLKAADIAINTDFYWLGDTLSAAHSSDKQMCDLTTLLLHELGHALGIKHNEERDSVMNPSLECDWGLANRSLSAKDQARVRWLYSKM